jgi:ribonuclease-3
MEDELDRLQVLIGYQFQDRSWLELALRHRSMGNNNNERLEFLGDAILTYVVSEELFRENPGSGEATLTRKRSLLTDRTTLKMVGDRIELASYIRINPGLRGKVSQKMVADTIEALIGAVYMDGGIEASICIIHTLVLHQETVEQVIGRVDWITRTKEWCDANRRPKPKYLTLEEEFENEHVFIAWLTIDNHTENGRGPSKKESMAEAARKMMAHLSSLEIEGTVPG